MLASVEIIGWPLRSQAGSHGWLRNFSGKKRTHAESLGHDDWSQPSIVQ